MAESTASAAECSALLDTLRQSGAERVAPVRFAYLAALARRAAQQPEAVRRPLTEKIAREAAELARQASLPIAEAAEPPAPAAGNPLTELLAYIAEHTVALPTPNLVSAVIEAKPQPATESFPAAAPELKSVTYFRSTWSKLLTEQQLTQTLAKAPENAGPMNAQHLVLRTLQLMRDRSPDYLQGFMSYIDSLIWLEHAAPGKPAGGRLAAVDGDKKAKPAKRSSGKR